MITLSIKMHAENALELGFALLGKDAAAPSLAPSLAPSALHLAYYYTQHGAFIL